MKFAKLIRITAIALLTLLAMPVRLAAQDNSQAKVKHHKYRLVDLGTFGGPRSDIADVGNGSPYINSRGNVVAHAMTKVAIHSNSNGTVCFPPDPNILHALRWQKRSDKVTDLGALPPARHNCSGAGAINDAGEIAGTSENGIIDPLIGVTEVHAVLWKHGRIMDLGTLGGNASGAGSINNHGQVVGFALNTIPDPYSFYGLGFGNNSDKSTQTRAVLWQEGKMQDLGTLGGPDGFALFVNQHGDITGVSFTSSMSVDPFLWQKGKGMADVGTLGGTSAGPLGLNNKGQIAGVSNLAGDATAHPFFWNGKKLKDLGTFGGSNGSANSLNDGGEVVGVADFPGDALHDAFLWKNGTMTDLGNLGRTSNAHCINSQGQVVGNSRINDAGDTRPFLWENGGPMVDLTDLVYPKPDVLLQSINAISESGEIAINGLPNGCGDESCEHAYVLIPHGDCDEDCEARIAASRNNLAVLQPLSDQQTNIRVDTRLQGQQGLRQGRGLMPFPGYLSMPSD